MTHRFVYSIPAIKGVCSKCGVEMDSQQTVKGKLKPVYLVNDNWVDDMPKCAKKREAKTHAV